MKLSHSKLSQILSCPMSYYLNYVQGIHQKAAKPALQIGSAVHWGIEHDTEDLDEFFNADGSFKQQLNYTREQLLAEAMVHGYMKHKDEIFEEMLRDPSTGEKLELLDELHELFLEGELHEHRFVGIIDLLLLTNKGFILVDYKTSTFEPDWDGYLDQLYRYIFELRSNFPDTPILKIAIINIRKSGIRQKKNENWDEYLNRLKFEYDVNDERLVNYHEFLPSDLNEQHIQRYVDNLAIMCDLAQSIHDNKLFFINYANAKSQYGKSEYYDIFYKTPDAEVLYWISDKVYDKDEDVFKDARDCRKIDLMTVDYATTNVIVVNKYDIFKRLYEESYVDLDEIISELKSRHDLKVDDELLELYKLTYIKEKEVNSAG